MKLTWHFTLVHGSVNNHLEFIETFSLDQLILCPNFIAFYHSWNWSGLPRVLSLLQNTPKKVASNIFNKAFHVFESWPLIPDLVVWPLIRLKNWNYLVLDMNAREIITFIYAQDPIQWLVIENSFQVARAICVNNNNLWGWFYLQLSHQVI